MRPRKHNRELPACVYLRHSAYYLVERGKWIRLGADLKTALAEYARRKAAPVAGMPGLLHRWLEQLNVAPATRKAYGSTVRKLTGIMAEFEIDQVKASDIRAILHHYRAKPATANVMRNCLIGALELACIEGIIERNVARDTRPMKTASRDRLIADAEMASLRANASPTMRVIIDLCHLTGQRIGDVRMIRYSDLTDDGIAFRQQKTGHRMIVAWTDELRAVVAEARTLHQSVKGMTLLHSRQGTPLSYWTIRTLWHRACEAAGVQDAHIHDLRAKAGTDALAQGLDSMALLGHTSESSHKRYQRSREIPVATPPSIGLSKKKTHGT